MEKRIKKVLDYILRVLSYVSLIVLVFVAIFLLFYIFSSQIAKMRGEKPPLSLYTIVSPSMEPNIKVYDVIVDTKVSDENDLKVGDIITFYSNQIDTGGYTITHRINDIIESDGKKYYVTKGDNNQKQDVGAIPIENVVGKVKLIIPGLGKIQFFISSKLGWLIIILIPALGILLMDITKLANIFKIRKQIEVIPKVKEVEKVKEKEENKKVRALIEKAQKANKKVGNNMDKKSKKVIYRAENIINAYRDSESNYYPELVKVFNEYHEVTDIDKTTNDLYIDHISRLCDLLVKERYFNGIVAFMLLLFLFMTGFTIYNTYRYFMLSKNIKNNIIMATMDTSIVVEYKNLDNFNAFVLSSKDNFQELKPLTLTISTTSEKKNKNYKVHYDIYLIEDNEGIKQQNLMDRNVFLYNVEANGIFDSINYLGKRKIEKNKIHIYSGEFVGSESEDVNIRMWINENTQNDYLNKQYRFKLYVSGYVEK